MRPIRPAMLAILAVVLFAGCASTPEQREIPADGSASASILNREDFGFTVYIVGSTGRYRLGFVDALSSGRFRIPGEMVEQGGSFQFYAEGRGAAGNYASEPFVVQPGAIVNWRFPEPQVYVR